ncbi:MAG: DegT/DnrJ/EryC1/StrS family aminotransferase [candidate division Zixibacteria bacterium]|nr:DegT/DnrJ/EryC1/StrS family aminotransferase [candidate division Zixibacteria bacterium]MDH3937681.1 DegT/DnrJ/EryC1/StrS family aminotransferase [candidate division Zixibacteria bacterium]MDH4032326.1 DegT/DnrJ/EryC1/StrS family aminotransferase [candidate division Zixibacteria bacterium]
MPVPLLDLSRQYAYLKPDLDEAVIRVLTHGKFILGPEVAELEKKVASLCEVDYAVGVASGTDALLLALRAAGVEPGDEVITTDFSFFATAGVIHRLGAKPVFVDIESDTYNIDPNLIEAAITDKTKVIVPVHLFGQVADMDPIMKVAAKHGLKVVEDAAQAIGSEYKGRKAGSIGEYGCFSFFPSKNLGAGGDGGMIVAVTEESFESCRYLRVHGAKRKYYHDTVGYNSRLATMQAAILQVKLAHLRKWSQQRIEHARTYDEALAGVEGLTTPHVTEHSTFHIYNQYTIALTNREAVQTALRDAGIGNCIYYPVPFHRQPCFEYLGYQPNEFPVTNKACEEVLSIPVYPELTAAEQDQVIDTIRKAVG